MKEEQNIIAGTGIIRKYYFIILCALFGAYSWPGPESTLWGQANLYAQQANSADTCTHPFKIGSQYYLNPPSKFLTESSDSARATWKFNETANVEKIPIRQYFLIISRQDSVELYSRDVWSKDYLGPATFISNDQVYHDVQFRFRGHCYGRGGCPAVHPNKSFKIKFSKQHQFEGKHRNINLNCTWLYQGSQGGIYRNKLPMEVFKLAGYPAPATRWCELYLNGSYMGLFMEQQEIDSGPFLNDWFGDDSGNLYRFDKVTVDSAGHRRFWREINVEGNVDWSDFDRFMLAVEIPADTAFWREIDQCLDLPHFLEHAALNMLCSVSDLYNYGVRSEWDTIRTHEVLENPMLYHHPFTDRFITLPWDVNECLNNPEMEILPGANTHARLLGRILLNPSWRWEYKSIFERLLATIYTEAQMKDLVNDIYEEVKEAMTRHNRQWQDYYGFYDLNAERQEMVKFVQMRIDYIRQRLFEDDNRNNESLPFNIHWVIDPALKNEQDFEVTTKYHSGTPYYLDRNYAFDPLNPILADGVLLKTFNDISTSSLVSESDRDRWTCTITIDRPAIVYLLWDARAAENLPCWLAINTWRRTYEIQPCTDTDMDHFIIFKRIINANEPLVLGHPRATINKSSPTPQSMYIAIFKTLSGSEYPATFRLWQNFPNPFNHATHLRYSIHQPGLVRLQIFNIKGELVQALAYQEQPIGVYDLVWNGTDNAGNSIAGGIYWCRLQVGDHTDLGIKMVCVR